MSDDAEIDILQLLDADASISEELRPVTSSIERRAQAEITRLRADKAALVEALEWYVDHDDAGPNDEYHLAGLERARAALAQAKAGEP